jgi:DNA polymerase
VLTGKPHEVAGLIFWHGTKGEDSVLTCTLPSGRKLFYQDACLTISKEKIKAAKEAGKQLTFEKDSDLVHKALLIKGGSRVMQKLYGGLLVENVVQALARDILAHVLLRMNVHGFHIVMHVHDEVVCEEVYTKDTYELFQKLSTARPDWAEGLPLASDCWRGIRYRK